jgi:2-polyprenyl-3-methyl-5-hydroxy-6-metoxy-1,4-benzoquinol methylase/uncharacterized protein YbaR (Trm112 family)
MIKEILVCPRDHSALDWTSKRLTCLAQGHTYEVVNGIPVMLLDDVTPTHPHAFETTKKMLDEPSKVLADLTGVDAFVQEEVAATSGRFFRPLIGRLKEYPIPELPIGAQRGKSLLDVGANWGRWSISGARKGFSVLALDPALEAIEAGQRVARQLQVDIEFTVADVRYLPLRDGCIDVVFSYSTLQHFSKSDARTALREVSRVLVEGGRVKAQMGNRYGTRCLYNQFRHTLTRANRGPFAVRYWTPRELRHTFEALVGPVTLSADGFFSLNAQADEAWLLPKRYAALVRGSELLRRASSRLNGLTFLADSLYVDASKS